MAGPPGRWPVIGVAVVQNASAAGEDEWSGDEMMVTGDCRMQRGDGKRKKAFITRNVQVKSQKAWGFPIYRGLKP